MDLAKDLKAAESFVKALDGIDPGKLVDTALKFMSSTRARIEAGEKRIADLEGKLDTALATIDKLSGVLGGAAGIDFSAFESEIDAMGKGATAADTKPTPSSSGTVDQVANVAAVSAAVPGADPTHVSEAVAGHAEAIADGSTHEDAKVAAETAARDVGATPDQASAIAAAIPAPVGDGAVKADPPAQQPGGVADAAPQGKTILADGTELKG